MFDFTLAVIRIDVNDLAVLPWEKIVFSCLSNFSNEVTSVFQDNHNSKLRTLIKVLQKNMSFSVRIPQSTSA